jgi:hypothetical protein
MKIDTQIHTQKLNIFLYFKLSYSKFAIDFQNAQTQNPNTQKIENPNPNLNLEFHNLEFMIVYFKLFSLL